jgi:hypothetical protein
MSSNSQQFLNSLKPREAKHLLTAVYKRGGYINLVNHRHMSSSLKPDQLSTMKSLRPQTGQLYFH